LPIFYPFCLYFRWIQHTKQFNLGHQNYQIKGFHLSSLDTEEGLIDDEAGLDPAGEDFIVNVGDIDDEEEDGDETEVPTSSNTLPGRFVLQERISEARIKYRRSENDTGSPEFQVAGISERITYLTEHLKLYPKDFSTRRGLVALVNKRRRLLNYLFREDVSRYKSLVESLGVRHKAPGRVLSKEQQYGRFPPQKPKKFSKK